DPEVGELLDMGSRAEFDQPVEASAAPPPRTLCVGDIVQIKEGPDSDPVFGGCLMTVEEVRDWGATGYVSMPTQDGTRRAYYRCNNEAMVLVGKMPAAPDGGSR